MTAADDDTQANESVPRITPVVPVHQQPDANLSVIAHMSHFVGFPMTFYMPWGIAAGHTASPNAFYKYLGEMARAGQPPDASPEFDEMIENFAATNFDAYSNMTASERIDQAIVDGFNLLAYINLTNVKCWTAGLQQPVEHRFLRLRLTDITAWTWGALS
ncbi:hypothetical protein JVX93_15970 [Mycolicibacterium boenickei]|nr:hypothetical protein JVX93_15970 [Mycolicibacterium boenickei]